jgi:hypothetical protein
MVFGPLDLSHSEKNSLHQKQLKKTNCWARDLWMLVCPVAGVTPLARLQTLPCPHSCCRSGPPLRDSLSQISSDIRFWDRNPALTNTHHKLLTEERIFIPAYYYAFETGGNFVKFNMFELYKGRFTDWYISTYQIFKFVHLRCVVDKF